MFLLGILKAKKAEETGFSDIKKYRYFCLRSCSFLMTSLISFCHRGIKPRRHPKRSEGSRKKANLYSKLKFYFYAHFQLQFP